MLARAQERDPGGNEFVRVDIRKHPSAIAERFDVITAFRFLLNADAEDQITALLWLRDRLRDDTGRLLINNHANFWSHKLLTQCWRRARGANIGRQLSGNVLSDRRARHLFALSGLEVEAVYGCGVVGAKSLRHLPYRLVRAIEYRAAGTVFGRIGVNQLYVVRARDRGTPHDAAQSDRFS
jgi:hypothetical protein